jgi:DUF1680 family protein
MYRREFIQSTPVAGLLLAGAVDARSSGGAVAEAGVRLEPFDYDGVRLLRSRWQEQYESARAFYIGVPDDDILCGYRAQAGLPAPGRPLGGWCGRDSNTVFGQWLSGMSRMARASGDDAMRDKAVRLMRQWSRTVKPDGDCGMRHYAYDKLVCGLVDLQKYAGHEEAIPLLEKVTEFAIRSFDRTNQDADPSHNQGYYGRPQEWYTLAENLYRAYQITGQPKFRAFAEAWHYDRYWGKFASGSDAPDAHGVHAYSHVNSFSSAAIAHEVTGDPAFLRAARNFHDYMQRFQCYATGGYGPNERFMAPDGSLGRALDTRSDTFEAVCGSWAGFKLCRYLMRLTGEARYGDWMERLFYNGVGAALPITGAGRNFYYADYRVSGGMKVYNWENYTCCSGTYIQATADYHNLVYYRDTSSAGRGLYVNLYLPSEVTWNGPAGEVHLVQDTLYPEAQTSTLRLTMKRPARFPLRFRVPAWTRGASVKLNGLAVPGSYQPGTWGSVDRTWSDGDEVEIDIPLALRMEPVDARHPDRVAVVRGPVVLVLEGAYHDPNFRLPTSDAELQRWLVSEAWSRPSGVHSTDPPSDVASILRVVPPDKSPVRLRFRPFFEVREGYPYFMYFDRRALPWKLW